MPDPKQREDRFAYENPGELEIDQSGATGEPLIKDDEEPPKTIHVHLPEEKDDGSSPPDE